MRQLVPLAWLVGWAWYLTPAAASPLVVRGSDGAAPVAGAEVLVADAIGVTDRRGEVTIEVGDEIQRVSVIVSAPGFETYTQERVRADLLEVRLSPGECDVLVVIGRRVNDSPAL